MSQNFSDRYGFKPAEPEITIREDAPDDLRFAIAQIAVRRNGAEPHSRCGLHRPICGARPQQLVRIPEHLG